MCSLKIFGKAPTLKLLLPKFEPLITSIPFYLLQETYVVCKLCFGFKMTSLIPIFNYVLQTMKQIIPLQYNQQEKGCSSNHTNVDFRLVTYDVPTRAHQRNLSNYIRWKAIFWCVIFLVKYERASFVRQGLKSRKAFALSWFFVRYAERKKWPHNESSFHFRSSPHFHEY